MNEIEQKAIRKDGDVTMCDLLNNEIEELTNQNEVEEMASVMCSSYKSKKGCKTCPTNWCYADECATMAYCNGYRNCKDKVVLERKEYEVLKIKEKEKHWFETCTSVWENAKIDGSKETAQKFYNLSEEWGGGVTFYKKARALAKQYGVEVE
jgi:hypothetical protein